MAYIYNNKGTLINGEVSTTRGFRHFGHGKQQTSTYSYNNIMTFNWSTGASPRIKFAVFGQFTAAKPSRSGYLITFNMNFDIDNNANVVWSQTGFISETGDSGTAIDVNADTSGQLKFRSYIWADLTYVNLSMHATCNKWDYLSSVTYH